MAPPLHAAALLLLLTLHLLFSPALSIGVNYGALGDNLPPPTAVAAFLTSRTSIDRVKLFDANPDFIRAFAHTPISLIITAPNGDIPSLAKPASAAAWVAANVAPFYPATNISLIALGNEILATADRNLIAHLVPAMRTLSAALAAAGFAHIRVSTPHSLGILSASEPPSIGRFRRGYDRAIFAPMLDFHRKSKTPFMVNPYPYFGYNGKTVDYALFRPNAGVYDPATKITYTNMFDAMLDAVHSAMDKLGYGDVEIAVGETGWPSAAEPGQIGVSIADAAQFNGNLIRKVNSGKGTPLMPGRKFETYIFSLFNENLKPGPIAERNWGLFNADLSPVYNVGLLRGSAEAPSPSSDMGGFVPTPSPSSDIGGFAPSFNAPAAGTPVSPVTGGGSGGFFPSSVPPASNITDTTQGGGSSPKPAPAPGKGSSQWCVAKIGAVEKALQSNIDYACSVGGVNCSPIQSGGSCFSPNTVQNHAAFVMNAFYQKSGRHSYDCDFAGTGVLTYTDPSYGTCKYSS